MKIKKKKIYGIVFSVMLIASCIFLFFYTRDYFTAAKSLFNAYNKTGTLSYYYSSLRIKYYAYLWFFYCFTLFLMIWDWVELLCFERQNSDFKRKLKWIVVYDIIQIVICIVLPMGTGVNFVLKWALLIMSVEMLCVMFYHYDLIVTKRRTKKKN